MEELKQYLPKVSKAIAGALMTVIGGLLVKYLSVNLTPELNDALEVVLDAVVLSAIGYLGVYLAPKNKA